MRGRRTRNEAFSLFSFQDIITSVTGVVVLVMLLLAVELLQRNIITDTPVRQSSPDDSAERVRQLDTQIAQLRQALEAGQAFAAEIAALPATELAAKESQLQQRVQALTEELHELRASVSRSQSEHAVLSGANGGSMAERLATVQKNVERLREQLESLKDSNRIVYNPNPNAQKAGWLVDLSPGTIRVAEPAAKALPHEFPVGPGNAGIAQFLAWCKSRDKDSEYFVLLIRPQSVPLYWRVREELEKLGFGLGYDLLGREAVVFEPTASIR